MTSSQANDFEELCQADPKCACPEEASVDHYKRLLKNHSNFRNQFLISVAASSTCLIAGSFYGWFSSSLPKISANEIPLNATQNDVMLLANVAAASAILGPIILTFFINRIGRKWTLCLFFLPFSIMGCTLYFATSFPLFLVASFFGYLNVEFSYSVASVYIAEICAPHLRGSLCGIVTLFFSTGIFLGYILDWVLTTQQSAVVFFTLSGMCAAVICWLPESAYFLLSKKQDVAARNAIRRLYSDEVVNLELIRLTNEIEESAKIKQGSFWDLFTKKGYRLPLFLILNLYFTNSFSGVDPVNMYAPTLLQDGCYVNLSPKITSFILAFLPVFGSLLLSFLLRFVRTRVMYIISAVCTQVSLVFLGIFYFFYDDAMENSSNQSYCDIFPFALLFMYYASYSMGIWSLSNIYFRELVPLSALTTMTLVCDVAEPIISTLSITFFDLIKYNISRSASVGFLLFCSVSGLIFFLCYMPETKGKTLEEIQRELSS